MLKGRAFTKRLAATLALLMLVAAAAGLLTGVVRNWIPLLVAVARLLPVVLRPGRDLTDLAEAAIADGADIIGMAGGGGSQALVAEVAAAREIPHVVVPAGTRNHFALDLGLDRNDVTGALGAFADGIERRIDLAEVNGRVFVNNASLGIYAKIVQSPEYRDAKLETAAERLPALLGPGTRPLDLRFTGPEGTEYPTAHLILVSNNSYQLDHIGGRGTRERMDDGVLGVVTARIDGPMQAQRFAALEATGQVRRPRRQCASTRGRRSPNW